QCELFGSFSILIQTLLGLLSLSTLIYKRYKEFPNRRPWKIWFFDVSKQVFGSIGVHFMNLLFSYFLSKLLNLAFIIESKNNDNDENDDQCNWYFINVLFDTTIGVPILWFFLYIIYKVSKNYLKIKGIDSGQYGYPPKFINYLKQLFIYILGLFLTKIIVYSLLYSLPIFAQISDFILNKFDRFPNFQIFLVIFLFPLIMNTLQYVCVDNIIQSPEY
ncbi:uncharacterized protein ASCRUDRAFT_24274, partial [Ascoidea rubescens DSM 1968]